LPSLVLCCCHTFMATPAQHIVDALPPTPFWEEWSRAGASGLLARCSVTCHLDQRWQAVLPKPRHMSPGHDDNSAVCYRHGVWLGDSNVPCGHRHYLAAKDFGASCTPAQGWIGFAHDWLIRPASRWATGPQRGQMSLLIMDNVRQNALAFIPR